MRPVKTGRGRLLHRATENRIAAVPTMARTKIGAGGEVGTVMIDRLAGPCGAPPSLGSRV